GHFAGLPFDYRNIDTSRWPYRLEGPATAHFGCELEHLERVLTTRALSLGAELRRGVRVDDFDESTDAMIVRAGTETFAARMLVGCDGGRSVVRKRAGFAFEGTEPEFTGYSIHVELRDPSRLPLGRHHTPLGTYTHWQPGVIAIA